MVVRVNKTKDYTVMSNRHLMDRRLTLKAKGLLSVVLALPDNWKYSVPGLAAISKEKEGAVNSALKELKEYGYLVITKKMPNQTESGRIEYEWDFYEISQKQDEKKQSIEKQGLENQGLEVQGLENQGLYKYTNKESTNKQNTNELSIKENIKESSSVISAEVAEKEEMFEQFWKSYPQCFRKVNKKGCKAKFLKIENLKEIFPDIIDSLEIQKKSKQWREQEGQFIPAPLTWINQERWTLKDPRTELQIKIDEVVEENYQQFLL